MLTPGLHRLGAECALCLLLHACAVQPDPPPSARSETLQVVVLPYLAFAPFFIADAEGYFADQRLRVEFLRMQRATEAVPALTQGQLDVLAGTISLSMMNAIAREAPIRIVADMGYLDAAGCVSTALMVRKGLATPGDTQRAAWLAGRRIEMAHATFEAFYVEKLLATGGLTLRDVQVVNLPDLVIPDALASGSVDIAPASEPWVTRITQSGTAMIWLPLQRLLPDFQFAFLLFGPTLLEENRDVGRRFMVAYLAAVRQYAQGKTARNLAIIARYTGLSEALLRDACWPSFRRDGRINTQSLLDFQAWGVDRGFLDRRLDVGQFWDSSFVHAATAALPGPRP